MSRWRRCRSRCRSTCGSATTCCGYEPRLTLLYGVAFHRDRRGGLPGDRALSRHLALRLAARSVQHRPRRDADRADLSAGHVSVHPARDAAALDPADRLAGADRAARRAAARLSAVQGSRPRPPPRARPRRQRAGAADQHQGRRRHLHPRDACATATRSTGSSACCPTRRRASAGEIYGVPVLGTIDALEAVVARPRPARPAPAKADHHRAGPRRRRGAPAARPRRRAGDPAGAAAAADRVPRRPATDAAARDRADRDRGSARPAAGGARPRRRWRG